MNQLLRPFALALIGLSVALLSACEGDTPTSVGGGTISVGRGSREESLNEVNFAGKGLRITDEKGNPLAGAKILIGPAVGNPFAHNVLVTDSKGQIALPPDWKSAEPLTIEAAGFTRATFFSRAPQAAEFHLRHLHQNDRNELKGETNGYPNLDQDGYVDVGLVYPTLSRAEVSTMQISTLISSETDTMSVIGQDVDVPSNLSVPTQTESVIFPIQLSKPVFRLYFDEAKTYRVATVHARFKVSDVLVELTRGTSFNELINKFDFIGGALNDVAIKSGSNDQSLSISQLSFEPAFTVVAPDFDPQAKMIATALPDAGNRQFLISDAKRLEPKEKRTLMAPHGSAAKGLVVSVLTPGAGDHPGSPISTITTVVARAASGSSFLDFVRPPELRSGSLILNPPRSAARIQPLMTYAVLSKVEVIDKGRYKLEKTTAQWELYSNDWATRLDLPVVPADWTKPDGKLRWETLFGGSEASAMKPRAPSGPEAFEKVTHVTRAMVDL